MIKTADSNAVNISLEEANICITTVLIIVLVMLSPVSEENALNKS